VVKETFMGEQLEDKESGHKWEDTKLNLKGTGC
jgi:hypothetical protein